MIDKLHKENIEKHKKIAVFEKDSTPNEENYHQIRIALLLLEALKDVAGFALPNPSGIYPEMDILEN